MSRLLTLAATVTVALAAGASSAHAARSPQVAVSPDGTAHIGWVEGLATERAWTPGGALTDAQYLSNAGSQVLDIDVATDASGASYFVWRRQRGGVATVEGRRRGPDGSLGPILALSSTLYTSHSARVAVDPDGNATFVWWRPAGTTEYIHARRLPAGGTLGPTLTLTPPGYQSRRPDVAMDANGTALVVWDRHASSGEGNDYVVQSRRVTSDGALGATQTLSGPASLIESPQVAMDAAGNALVGWIRPESDRDDVPEVRRRSASGGLGPVQTVAPPTRHARDLRLAMSPSGSAMIVWARFVGDFQEVQGRHRSAGGGFGSIITLSSTTDGRDAGFPQAAMDADGDALVVWERHSPGSGAPEAAAAIQARRRSSAGAVGPLQSVSALVGVEQTNPAVGVAPDGTATIAWEAHGQGEGASAPAYDHAILGRRRQPDGTFGATRQLDGP